MSPHTLELETRVDVRALLRQFLDNIGQACVLVDDASLTAAAAAASGAAAARPRPQTPSPLTLKTKSSQAEKQTSR